MFLRTVAINMNGGVLHRIRRRRLSHMPVWQSSMVSPAKLPSASAQKVNDLITSASGNVPVGSIRHRARSPLGYAIHTVS
jgi:hypothetical protein